MSDEHPMEQLVLPNYVVIALQLAIILQQAEVLPNTSNGGRSHHEDRKKTVQKLNQEKNRNWEGSTPKMPDVQIRVLK